MLSFDELVFINKAKLMFKITQGISSINMADLTQIEGPNSEDTMACVQIQTKKTHTQKKTPKPKLNLFKTAYFNLE